MKILLYTDVHLSTTSSIVRKRGEKYTERLENVIASVSWAEDKALELNCDEVICLGDFFDKPALSDEEITALADIRWNKLPHTFIVGNHESSVNGLRYNSVKSLHTLGFNIISEPTTRKIDNNTEFVFIPYLLEDDREPLEHYVNNPKHSIIFSHNDIKGIQYGKIESPNGFELSDIEANCKLFLNGHLHNGSFLNKNKTILNLGNLTGQNFSEDASCYNHCVLVLDTDTLELKFIENPYAYNFYKLDITDKTDIDNELLKLKNNAVVSFRCVDRRENDLRESINKYNSINNYKIVIYSDNSVNDELVANELINVDHLKQFKDFILDQMGTSKIVQEELYEICK